MDADRLPPVLILGCGRSGTSIFGEMFQHIAGYDYHSEPGYADMLKYFGTGHAVKVPTESPGFAADAGLSFPLAHLLAGFPRTVVFWIVRHPFDAVASLRIGIGDGWRHHPRPPDWQAWLKRPVIERCAHHWQYINLQGFDAVRSRATVVRFEELIRSPAGFAEAVCKTLDIRYSDYSCTLATWASRVQNSNNDRFVEAMTSRRHSRPDHTVRVERWRENLQPEDTRRIADMVKVANEAFGYSLDDDRAQTSCEYRDV